MRMRAAWDFGSGFTDLCLGNKGRSLVWRELLKSQMIREADFARLFVVWLNSVACSRVPTSAYVCINYVYVSAAGSKCFLMFPRLKKKFFMHFVPGNSGGCFETCRFLCSSMHTCLLYTHSQKAVDLLCKIVLSRRVLDGERRAWWRQRASPGEMGT